MKSAVRNPKSQASLNSEVRGAMGAKEVPRQAVPGRRLRTWRAAVWAGLLSLAVLSALTGCSSDDGGGGGNASGSVYYGVGFYDPWYCGPGYYPPDVVVPPPGERPPVGAHPEHPLAKPPTATPTPRPAPSIPSTPRPMARPSFRR